MNMYQMCMSEEYLERYRAYLNHVGLPQHPTGSVNRLRDTEDVFTEGGHCFAFNRELLFSYDVCGGCEAHALLYSMRQTGIMSVRDAVPLYRLEGRAGNVNFANCPD